MFKLNLFYCVHAQDVRLQQKHTITGIIYARFSMQAFRLYDGPDLKLFILVGWGQTSCLLLDPPGSNWCFSFAPELVGYSAPRDLHRRAAYSICESWFLIHQDVYHDLFVCS